MLEQYAALKKRHEAKLAARGIAKAQYEAALKEIEEEFGDTETPLEEERTKIFSFAKENNFRTHFERNGSFEIRKSSPKYTIISDSKLFNYLVEHPECHSALNYKKAQVNELRKSGDIPDEIVHIEQEEQIAITVTYPKE